jgi:diadenosine tetraphosphate (Ap4A) HIT family hydrolase
MLRTHADRHLPIWRAIISSMTFAACPFCLCLALGDLLLTVPEAAAFADGFPLNAGHTLVVPRRHVENYFDLSLGEQEVIWRLVAAVKAKIDSELSPAGYNVGFNVGAAGGQTVAHAHVHVIPRFAGDVEDPRGGIRWVIPARAPYWDPGRDD